MEQYTHEDWKAYKKAFNLTNIKVAELLGLESKTVSNLTQRRNALPRWAVGMIYTWKQLQTKDFVIENKGVNYKISKNYSLDEITHR